MNRDADYLQKILAAMMPSLLLIRRWKGQCSFVNLFSNFYCFIVFVETALREAMLNGWHLFHDPFRTAIHGYLNSQSIRYLRRKLVQT